MKKFNKKNWKIKKLSEVCVLEKGKKPKHFSGTGNPYLTARSIRNLESPQYTDQRDDLVFVNQRDIVIIMDGSNSGEIFKGLKGILASTMGRICFSKEEYLSGFMQYFLVGHRKKFMQGRTGSAIPHLNKEQFFKLEIPVVSLEEQKNIVKKLDDAFERIDEILANAEKNLANARELFQSSFYNIFLNQEKNWQTKKLGDICANLDSKRIPITKKDRISGKYPYYGASGIVDYVEDYIFDGEFLLVSEDGANLVDRNYPIAFGASSKFWVNNHAHILKFENGATQRFVEYYLNNLDLNPWISGMAQPKLNQGKLNSIGIEIPESLEEQKQIVKKLDTLSTQVKDLEKIYQQKIVLCDELKKSVLYGAFNGKL